MALKLYQHAADQDLPAAKFCLGEAARDGVLVPYSMPEDGEYLMEADEETAFEMFMEAAGQGYVRAKLELVPMVKARAKLIIEAEFRRHQRSGTVFEINNSDCDC